MKPERSGSCTVAERADQGARAWVNEAIRRVEVLPETGSTNAEMAARARAGAPAGSVQAG